MLPTPAEDSVVATAEARSTIVAQRPRMSTPAAIVLAIAVAVVILPVVLIDPQTTSFSEIRLGIGAPGHPLGTDSLGRDTLSRLVSGARVSLIVGVSAVVIAMTIGGAIGTTAGTVGGRVDAAVMRGIDVLVAFPALVLALTIATYMGPSIPSVIVALAVAGVPAYARLSRAVVLPLRDQPFVIASRLSGASTRLVITRHLLPSVLTALSAYALLAVGAAIIGEAALSFLGLGVRPPTPSWGTMIAEGRAELERAPHLVLVPGITLFIVVLCLNVAADQLSDGRRRQQGTR